MSTACPQPAATPPPAAKTATVREPHREGRARLLLGRVVLPLLVAVAAAGGALAVLSAAGGLSATPAARVAWPAAEADVAPPAVVPAPGPRRGGVYAVVDSVENRLRLERDGEVLLDAPCSTGTGAVLEEPGSGRTWVFDTPRGAFRVLGKRRDPVWTKPDWAFVEEGLPVPTDVRRRRDFEALGDFSLDLGDGYLIHGTPYQRLLGRSVTHGCIRLGDADLEEVYRRLRVGSPVYIF